MASVSRTIWLVFELGSDMRREEKKTKLIHPAASDCQLSEMNIGFSIYARAPTVNVLQLNTRPRPAGVLLFLSAAARRQRQIIETCQLSPLFRYLGRRSPRPLSHYHL